MFWTIAASKSATLLKMESAATIDQKLDFFCFNLLFFFNWDSLHARLNSQYEAWSYKKKKHKKIRAHRKSV